ncbi:prepilin-type N-terminal cleavage/methylation domain-containing protein [Colwelliaceae bacterium MEBiC 14330]
MRHALRKNLAGFTLIEMITVIIIIGTLSAAISTYVKFSTEIYTNSTAREQLSTSVRFALERFSRDVRNALPNSLRLINGNQCLELTPIVESTTYTKIPVPPASMSNTVEVIPFNEAFSSDWKIVVYPLKPEDVYPLISSNIDKIHDVASIIQTNADKWIITLDNSVHFAEQSPTQRLYFVDSNETVTYCLQGTTLTRNATLIAQDIVNLDSATPPFEILSATLQRNAMVQIKLILQKNNETITFNHEIQVLNVP